MVGSIFAQTPNKILNKNVSELEELGGKYVNGNVLFSSSDLISAKIVGNRCMSVSYYHLFNDAGEASLQYIDEYRKYMDDKQFATIENTLNKKVFSGNGLFIKIEHFKIKNNKLNLWLNKFYYQSIKD
jgi:C-terminal processing protease CtpA/Prc